MPYFLNPRRRIFRSWRQRLRFYVRWPFIQFGLWLGFPNVDYGYISGYKDRIKIGQRCSTMNTLFNTQSGTITIGDDTIFGDNCMLITGYHRFYKGKRAKLQPDSPKEVPDEGHDITIGRGCYIGSASIILRGVTIGDNVIVGAGSVVTKNVPDNCFVCGVPAQVKKIHDIDPGKGVKG
jgi:maltose O-acetyltransferase